LKNRRFGALLVWGLLLTGMTLGLTACDRIYYYTSNNYAGRPTPPSGLQQRVMAAYTSNGSSGGLAILDGLRDIRSNVQNTIPAFSISGFGSAEPIQIINYPEQTTGYVLSYTDGNLVGVNYSKESSNGTSASFGAYPKSVTISPDGTRAVGAAQVNGVLYVAANGVSTPLTLPNVYKVAINRGNTVILAMVRNSNTLYRIIKLNTTMTTVAPPGAIDCEPLLLPVYCVVPVPGTFDRPYDAVFSADGNSVYVLNCGPECGGTSAGVTVLQAAALTVNTLDFASPTQQALPVPNPIPIPGGVTAGLSNGSTLYLSGQSLYSLNGSGTLGTTPRADGLLTGYLTPLNLSTFTAGNPISISDGTHSKMLFADDSTLWVGSQQCANGERASIAAAQMAARGYTDQSGNYNCLTRVSLSGAAPTATLVPAVVQSNVAGTAPVQVPYQNTDLNAYYYGSLTGLCWVQNYHKVYTAYGGQIHAFNTADGSEINNSLITIQGTVLDVAYMDALTNEAN
jgi:hypothetical protein